MDRLLDLPSLQCLDLEAHDHVSKKEEEVLLSSLFPMEAVVDLGIDKTVLGV